MYDISATVIPCRYLPRAEFKGFCSANNLHSSIFMERSHRLVEMYYNSCIVTKFIGKYDIVGPYYTSNGSMTSKFLYACVIETLKLFHLHSLKTLIFVCDGASSNLTMIKATQGLFGSYPISKGSKFIQILHNIMYSCSYSLSYLFCYR